MYLSFNENGIMLDELPKDHTETGFHLYRIVIAVEIPDDEELCYSKIDFGDIKLKSNGRTFHLGITSGEEVTEEGECRIYCRFEDIDDTIKEYSTDKDADFNFLKEDWLSDDIEAEIYLPSEYKVLHKTILLLDDNLNEIKRIKVTK
jgi:hypothetical protein